MSISFAMTAAEARHPVMMDALCTGVAMSLGMPKRNVNILTINGEQLGASERRRHLSNSSASVEFRTMSESDDAGAVAQLRSDLKAVATEGSLVANVQKAASEKGVLIVSLRDMVRSLPKPTVNTVSVAVEMAVQVPVPTTVAPSLAPTFALTAVACSDGIKNGNESDVDCGGQCPLCALNQKCSTSTGSQNVVCFLN